MQAVHPYLLFKGNAAEAFEFYESVFQANVTSRTYYREFGSAEELSMQENEMGLLANISLPIAPGIALMGNDVTDSLDPNLRIGGNVQITLVPDDAADANRLFEALSAGGKVRQALEPAPFAELYGEVTDQFGTQWIVIIEGNTSFGE